MKKIGIMGGTFDPIHVGHLMIAEAVWDEFKLDKVIFIPSANPPHKHSVMTSAKHRFNMTLLATCSNPHFEVSSIEMERSGPSYKMCIRDSHKSFSCFHSFTHGQSCDSHS